ncbi:unnamed protein product [Coffea canephora]|uniref:J domain-containing protein n=1 Tax=Coffea canephora TaxID=49390 RepID=A0A068UIC6_COFCA|nr:chaperone protein dnaJ 11, chloroplastic-like [Coffea arabica]CDP07388.1 unnamed protein product [Coffea canephora]
MASSIGSTFAGAAPSCARFKHHLHQPSRISAAHAAAGRTSTSTSHIAPQTSLYEVLGIPMGATCQEIKVAYRRLARVLHPDVASSHNTTRGSQDTSAAADEFMRVHKAYTTLSDPEKRADYDRTLFRLRRPAYVLSATNRGSGYYARRTWETDQCW